MVLQKAQGVLGCGQQINGGKFFLNFVDFELTDAQQHYLEKQTHSKG